MPVLWVTGAKGFLGRYVARHAAARGWTVHGIGHGAWLEDDHRQFGVTRWLNSSVTAAGLEALASDAGMPDAIVHLAGGASVGASLKAPREDFDRTVNSTAELVEWMRTRAPQAKLVAGSSAAVYGDRWSGPIPVDAPYAPCSPYGTHKAAMELLVRSYARCSGGRVAIVRLFSVYGPGLHKQLLWDLMTRLAQAPGKLTLSGDGSETRDFVYAADAASLVCAAIDVASDECPAFNGGRGAGVAVRELVKRLVTAWRAECAIEFDGVRRAGDPQMLVADMAASGAITPESWTALDTGLALTVEAARARFRG